MFGSDLVDSVRIAIVEGNFSVAALFCFVAGFLSSLTPCVYPLIPITLATIGTRKYASWLSGFSVSAAYVAGMVLLFSALGISFSALGILFGAVLQQPIVTGLLGVLFIIFGFAMLGSFQFSLPLQFMNWLARLGGAGYRGAFLMGLVAGLIASPCIGPVLAFILTLIAQRGDLKTGSILMVSFAMGLGLPFLALGTFSALLSRLPKSGRWLNWVKIGLGIILFGVGIYYIQMALPNSEQEAPQSAIKWRVINETSDSARDLQTILLAAKKSHKPVLIDFYADWCIACKELERLTYPDSKVQKALSRFVAIKVDLTRQTPSLDQIQRTYGVLGLPTILFFDSEGKLLSSPRAYGFLSPTEMTKVLTQIR